jgi:hypothetical protein
LLTVRGANPGNPALCLGLSQPSEVAPGTTPCGPLSLLGSYTYSKSYDQSSSIQEQVDPFNYHRLDGISAFDLKHNFVVSYNYDLPVAHLWRPNRLTSGWALSGITRFSTGVPVTFATTSDNYLVFVQDNGVNNISLACRTMTAPDTK